MSQKSRLEKLGLLENEFDKSTLLQQMEAARRKLHDYLEEFRKSIDDNLLVAIRVKWNDVPVYI